MVRFFSKFRIQSRMILVNSVPNLKSVAPKLQKLSHCKVSIIGGRLTTNEQRTHDINPAILIVSSKRNFVETKIIANILLKEYQAHIKMKGGLAMPPYARGHSLNPLRPFRSHYSRDFHSPLINEMPNYSKHLRSFSYSKFSMHLKPLLQVISLQITYLE